MRSPICHLFSAINSSPFKIAPEKEQDLKTIVDDKKIIISVVSEPGFNIRVRKNESNNSHEIVLTVASLEYIWAFSMAVRRSLKVDFLVFIMCGEKFNVALRCLKVHNATLLHPLPRSS